MGKSVSDVIEEFIKSSLDDDEFIELSRNDLAKFFSCVPSQINYVLNTRFTVNRGFVVVSQRGGGGYIKIVRMRNNDDNFLKNAYDICLNPINIVQANQIVDQMLDRGLITAREANIIRATISVRALNNPINIDQSIRANIMREVIVDLMNEQKLNKKDGD